MDSYPGRPDRPQRRKSANRFLQTPADDMFRRAMDNAADGVVIHRAGNIEYSNRAFARLLGIEIPSVLVNRNFHQLINQDDLPALLRLEAAGSGAPVAARLRLDALPAAASRIEFTCAALEPAAPGDNAGLVMWQTREITDGSALAELEERARQFRHVDDKVRREIDDIASRISHDVRAPVRAISGFVNLLKVSLGENLDADSERYISLAVQSSDRLARIVEGMLDLSRSGRNQVMGETIDTAHLVGEILRELAPDERVKIFIDDLAPLFGEPTMLAQVVKNLIANAIVYSSRKELPIIAIKCEVEPGRTVFSVSDNGIGFAEEERKKLFSPFSRLSNTGGFDGTGIGLSIVRKIIEHHQGHVWATGAPGEGATFGFALPLPQTE